MFKKKIRFRTIKFEGVDKLFDYPKDLDIPRIGETVLFENNSGIVKDIRHITTGIVSEVKIVCEEPHDIVFKLEGRSLVGILNKNNPKKSV